MKKSKYGTIIFYASIPIVFLGVLLVLLLAAEYFRWLKAPVIWAGILCTAGVLILYIKKVFAFLIRMDKYVEKIVDEQEAFSESELDSLLKPFGSRLIEEIRKPLEREYTALLCKKQAEVNALQSQINPHFLYNTLDSIRGRAVMEDAEVVADMIESLANFFRYNISRRGNMVTLAEELRNIDTYMEIQNFRFGDRFSMIKEFSDEDFNTILIPKLTLQPIVENAIFHGLEQYEGKGVITIHITITKERTLIRVSDNGVGMSKDKLKELNEKLSEPLQLRESNEMETVHGIAVKNVSDRIKLCFGEQYGLVIYSAPDIGTDVEIRMPHVEKNKAGL